MNIAYCVLCHRNTPILQASIRILSQKSDLYIHVDAKSKIEDFKEISDLNQRVFFIKERINVKWGHFSQIEAMINLFQATVNREYDYIFLISGDCLPIKNNEEIERFLISNKGKEFVGIGNSEGEAIRRTKYVYDDKYFKKKKSFFDKLNIEVDKIFKRLEINESAVDLPRLYKGCSWLGITGELRDYILNFLKENRDYIDAFRDSVCGDEVFFNTIICNSRFKDSIYKYGAGVQDVRMALRYIDWSIKPMKYIDWCPKLRRLVDWLLGIEYPRLLDESDFEKIDKTECIFARKFNDSIDIKKYEEYFGL